MLFFKAGREAFATCVSNVTQISCQYFFFFGFLPYQLKDFDSYLITFLFIFVTYEYKNEYLYTDMKFRKL